jgi:hypothetical protein
MTIDIKHRATGAIIWSGEAANMAEAIAKARAGDAYLGGAYLGGADLRGAYLRGADLGGADLGGADLGGAYLGDAREVPASLANHKDPETPFERRTMSGDRPALSREERAARRRARRAERMAAYRAEHPDVPVVECLDARILRGIETQALVLDMGRWHGEHPNGEELAGNETPEMCGTTHCRAGSAIHLAGVAGYALEKRLGSAEQAGRAIYLASTGRSPHFYASNERALADIRRCAADEPLPKLADER